MIFINHLKGATAAKEYYSQHIAPGDYYGKDAAEMKGIWHGRGAEMLGLSGEVAQADFFRLCDNINPKTGEPLTPRTNRDRRVLTDFTFDAPKSVTLAFEMGGEGGKGDSRILTVFQEATRETMAEIEADVKTRVRKKGADEDRLTGNLIWAEHVHRTTRPVDGIPDPQLHIHGTCLNATFDPIEKKWKAIQLGDVVRDKGYYQAAFHSRLAGKLKDLGYGIEKDGNSFRLAGIERATVEKFSRRTAIIEAEAERLAIEDEATKRNLGRRTRENRGKDRLPMSELRAEWDGRLSDKERLLLRTAGSGFELGDALIRPDQAKEYALEHAFQKASAVSERRLKAEALTYSVGHVMPEDVADLPQHPEAISRQHDGQLFVTTKTVLRDEIAMLQFAKDGQRAQKSYLYSVNGLRSGFDEKSSQQGVLLNEDVFSGLSTEQRKAAIHILNSRDTVTGIVGKAGTGKTRMMRATVDAIENGENRVSVFAPSAQARDVLKKEGFREAATLEMLLRSDRLQEQTKGQVLWVDEAGLISSRDMRRLMDVAKKNGNRVILSGDYTQHSSVEAGDAFRLLEKEAGVRMARLTEIRRQTQPGYKKAVEAISTGTGKDAQKGFDALAKMGWVIESPDGATHEKLVNDYLEAVNDGKSALIIAPTHAEGNRLTEELRAALKERGAIGQERVFKTRRAMGWTDAQKGDMRNYEPGMIVEFHQNAKGFKRGEAVVVVDRRDLAALERGQGRGNASLERRQRRDNAAPVTAESEGLVVMRQDGSRATMPLDQAKRFEVYRTSDIALGRGDRIRITKNGEAKPDHFRDATKKGNVKGTRLNNGDIFTVEGFTKEGDIRLEKGKLLPKGWGHMALGYVDTSYASQGKTVDRVFVALGKISLAAADAKQWYVSLSRGREMAKVYLEDKQEVRQAIARTGERLSAVELTKTRLASNWRQRFYQTVERNRVGRFLAQRAAGIADYLKEKGRGLSYG